MLHRVGVPATAEDLEAFPAQALVLLDTVVLVPNEVRAAHCCALRHHFSERAFGNKSVTDQRVTCLLPLVIDAGDRELHIVPFNLQPHREAETREPLRDDDKLHSVALRRTVSAGRRSALTRMRRTSRAGDSGAKAARLTAPNQVKSKRRTQELPRHDP